MFHLHQHHQWRGHSWPCCLSSSSSRIPSSLGCPLLLPPPCVSSWRISAYQPTPRFLESCPGYSPWFSLHGNSLPNFVSRLSARAGDTEASPGDENGAIFHSAKLKFLQLLPILLLGLGALFSQQLPALADVGQHGAVATALRRVTFPEVIKSGWAGLMAGCLHALTGPDHLAALAPLCIGRAKLESTLVGALWGCGHDAGQIIFGLFFLLLKGKLKIELLQIWASRVVGITLVAIGAVGLKEAQEVPVSVLATESASPADSSDLVENKTSTHRLRTFATGIVYGLQPDALLMILPALALPSRLAGAAYLGMFLLGTIVAMGSYTAFIGSCGEALQKRLPRITQRLSVISSVVAIVFGASVLVGELVGINFFE